MNTDLTPWEERWAWLAGSILLAFLVSWIGWAFRHMEGRPRRIYNAWCAWPGRPWVEQTARLLYTVGIPALALFWRGALKESGLGLQPFPWQETSVITTSLPATWDNWLGDILSALALGTTLILLVAVARRPLQRANISPSVRTHDVAVSLREAVVHEIHWSFYREPFILLWSADIGVWIGALVTLLEAALNPARWADLRNPTAAYDLLLRASLAVSSASLFLLTHNIWIAILMHALLFWYWGTYTPVEPSPKTAQRRTRGADDWTQNPY